MLDYEIRELIQKSLPEQVGTVLRSRLDQAEKDAAAVVKLTADLKATSDGWRATQEVMRQHDAIDKRNADLEKREAAVAKRECAAELNEFKVKAAESAKSDIYDLAALVFRNPTHVRHESQTRNIVVPGNSYPQQVFESNSSTETIE